MTITHFVIAVSFIALFFIFLFFAQHFMFVKEQNKLNERIEYLQRLNGRYKFIGILSDLKTLNEYRDACHKAAEKWWIDLKTNQDLRIPNEDGSLKFNVPEKLCLIHSEISEAMEGYRKNLNDDHLPHLKMIDVELADAVIRIMDLCGAMNIDIDSAIKEKLAYNAQRADHKIENRLKEDGKAF